MNFSDHQGVCVWQNENYVNDEEFNFMLEVALRRQKICKTPIEQFYFASSLLAVLNETRVKFFNDEDLRLLHQTLFGHNLKEIENAPLTKYRIKLAIKISLFGSRIVPYLPQYDSFFLNEQYESTKLATFYLSDILGTHYREEAVKRITTLMDQRTFPKLGAIIAESYDNFRKILGDLWTDTYDDILIGLLLDLFSEKLNEAKLKKSAKINTKQTKGKWKFPIKDIPEEFSVPYTFATQLDTKAVLLLMKYAKTRPMDRSTQIQILNAAVIYLRNNLKSYTDAFYSMPIIQSEDISEIVPQLFCVLPDRCDPEILLRLVHLHPCAILIRIQARLSGMDSMYNKAIIGSYYGVHSFSSSQSYEQQLDTIKPILLDRFETSVSPTLKNILLHYAIQLRCAIFDPLTKTYCAYRENNYWSLMKSALKDPEVREYITQFMDDYDSETNFMVDLLPKQEKRLKK